MRELAVNNKLWIISDTHFGHQNIVQFQQRPTNHEVIMLSEWIWRVGENDQILHLGDVFMGKGGNPKRWAAIVARLPGQKFLVMGNHDKAERGLYKEAGFKIVDPFIFRGHAFTHRPVTPEFSLPWIVDGGWHTNIHGHVHANEYRPEHDGTYLSDRKYVNVSVEVMDYAPRQLGSIWRP